ncbi:type I secretion system permease/ATPase [Variovorax robiniae]|uniref:Type I secretion system permease/ATPase n=1 Tax=Variovorax robiniae TaxID=1836199 RepID=A0ABU8XD55_9BURK
MKETLNFGVQSASARSTPVLVSLRHLFQLLGHSVSEESMVAGLPVSPSVNPQQVVRIAHEQGFEAVWRTRRIDEISPLLLPCVLMRKNGQCAVLVSLDESNVTAVLSEVGDSPVVLSRADLEADFSNQILLVKPQAIRDKRSEVEPLFGKGHWFWKVIAHFKVYYVETAVIAALVNVLALASTFFTMNVYDRVISNKAYTTLWTLAIGVMIALALEYFLRNLRVWLLDNAGKKADLLLGSQLFKQVLATRLEARPASAGAFANMLKEYESLRDFATSTVLVALSDLPFLLMFLVVLYIIAGPLFIVPLIAVPAILMVGALAQLPLSRYINENQRESSVKHGVLIEAIESAETLKALRAEGMMQAKYEHSSAITAITANKSRLLSNSVLNFNYVTSTLCTVAQVVWGSYLIGEGKLTMGALIGAVMLTSRALAPLTALNGLAVRLQQARNSYKTLSGIMDKPTDREKGRSYLVKPVLKGDLSLKDLKFSYAPDLQPAVRDVSVSFARGEKVAILGRVGSGKTTLLKLVAGLYLPQGGMVTIDNVDAKQIDPADFRRNVLYVGQNAQMFYGTLRENLKAGNPFASDEDMVSAATAMGVHAFAQTHPLGYDMVIGERGENLSGGQRQCVALARAVLVNPAVLLLDEPTSAMDAGTEAQALKALFAYADTRTVVLVTHKLQLLEYVQRVLVVDHGLRVADGPRDSVLAALQAGKVMKADANPAAAGAVPKAPAPKPVARRHDEVEATHG